MNMARKIKLVELYEMDDKMMVIILEGSLKYRGQVFVAGQLVNREEIQIREI